MKYHATVLGVAQSFHALYRWPNILSLNKSPVASETNNGSGVEYQATVLVVAQSLHFTDCIT